MALVLQPTVKEVRPQERHYFCPERACRERLATGSPDTVLLEPGYRQEDQPGYPPGTWWRRNEGAYKGLPRGRAVRKAGVEELARYTTERRPPRVVLPEGAHVVACRKCGGLVRISG